jgi:hypothetical protein
VYPFDRCESCRKRREDQSNFDGGESVLSGMAPRDGWPTQARVWLEWGCSHVTDLIRFVTFCCYHRRRLLTTDESRRIFESALERVRRSYRLHVYGYVVMPEHVHLLLSEPPQDTLADALKSLKQGVSRRLIGDADHF